MSLAGCKIIPIDLNFHLQKCLEIFDKNSTDKIQFKNYKEVNPPCLMPIRVNINIPVLSNGIFHILLFQFILLSPTAVLWHMNPQKMGQFPAFEEKKISLFLPSWEEKPSFWC